MADLIIQVLTWVILTGYAVFLYKSGLSGKVLRRSALVIFLAGIALYMYGFHRNPELSQTTVTCFLRSALESAKLFIYDHALLELEEAQKVPYFTDIFMLVMYAAMLTSISTFIVVFGKRLRTFFILRVRRRPFRHVFLGINKNSEIIAESLSGKDVAFIEFPDESSEEEMSARRVLNRISSEDSVKKAYHGAAMLKATCQLSQGNKVKNVFETIGLGRLSGLVDRNTSFYLLSENAEKNMSNLLALLDDTSLSDNVIHVCMKREGLSKSYRSLLAKTKAHFIYPSSLAVVELMRSDNTQPACMMDVNPDGTVSGEFNAMIVGFGETGQAAAKYLYEFSSAFSKDGSILPVRIYVCDEHMEREKGDFFFSCPEMAHNDILCYENHGLDSGLFWDNLMARLDSLNCIEISMQSDAANLELACTIYSYVQKKRKNRFRNFKIFVRKRYTPEFEARLINRLNEKAGQEVIVLFGEYEKIFRADMIVSGNESGINKSAVRIAETLKTNYACLTGKDITAPDGSSYSGQQKYRMEMHQFISRSNHIATKKLLAGGRTDLNGELLENLAKTEHLRYRRYLLSHGYTYDKVDDDVFKTNHQLCLWSELSEDDKQYHRDMVRSSLM